MKIPNGHRFSPREVGDATLLRASSELRILLVSPHSDDVALSLGGHIQSGLIPAARCVLLTVFSESNWAPNAPRVHLRARAATRVRRKEDESYACRVGLAHSRLSLEDSPLRLKTDSLREFFEDGIERPRNDSAGSVLEAVFGLPWLRVYVPLGMGSHVDHLVVRRVAVRVKRPYPVSLYEEMPYAGTLPLHQYRDTLLRRTAGLCPSLLPRGPWMREKMKLLRYYASQLGPAERKAVLLATARIGGERVWSRE